MPGPGNCRGFFFHTFHTATMENSEELNSGITYWSNKTFDSLKSELDDLGVVHAKYSRSPVALKVALKKKLSRQRGSINRIAYGMPRHAVFLHKGVSRGHPINNPRKKKEWFNPVDDRLPELADIVAEGQGNLIINSLSIR